MPIMSSGMSHQPTRTKPLKAIRTRLGSGSWASAAMSWSIAANIGSRQIVIRATTPAGDDQDDDRVDHRRPGLADQALAGLVMVPSIRSVSGTPPRASATLIMLRNSGLNTWARGPSPRRASRRAGCLPDPADHRPEAVRANCCSRLEKRLVEVDARVEIRRELAAELRELARADPAEEDPLPPFRPGASGSLNPPSLVRLPRLLVDPAFGREPAPTGLGRKVEASGSPPIGAVRVCLPPSSPIRLAARCAVDSRDDLVGIWSHSLASRFDGEHLSSMRSHGRGSAGPMPFLPSSAGRPSGQAPR